MSATILVVDDEENARHIITSFLGPKGYEVLGAATLANVPPQWARNCSPNFPR